MIARALIRLRPGSEWTINGDTYEGVTWLDESTVKPTEEEVAEAIAIIHTELQNTEYQRLRASAYPSIGDQLDALFHAGVFPEETAAQLQEVKDKYPKL